MMNFKVGDIVKCINVDCCSSLELGKKYKVIKSTVFNSDDIILHLLNKELQIAGYFSDRFKLHEEVKEVEKNDTMIDFKTEEVKEEFYVNYSYGNILTFPSIEAAEEFIKNGHRNVDYATIYKRVKVLKKNVPVPVWEEVNV